MIKNQSPDFPSEMLVPENGSISGGAGKYSIAIKLQQFNFDDEVVNQTLEIEDCCTCSRKRLGFVG